MFLRCTVEATVGGKKHKAKGADQGLECVSNGLRVRGILCNRVFPIASIAFLRVAPTKTSLTVEINTPQARVLALNAEQFALGKFAESCAKAGMRVQGIQVQAQMISSAHQPTMNASGSRGAASRSWGTREQQFHRSAAVVPFDSSGSVAAGGTGGGRGNSARMMLPLNDATTTAMIKADPSCSLAPADTRTVSSAANPPKNIFELLPDEVIDEILGFLLHGGGAKLHFRPVCKWFSQIMRQKGKKLTLNLEQATHVSFAEVCRMLHCHLNVEEFFVAGLQHKVDAKTLLDLPDASAAKAAKVGAARAKNSAGCAGAVVAATSTTSGMLPHPLGFSSSAGGGNQLVQASSMLGEPQGSAQEAGHALQLSPAALRQANPLEQFARLRTICFYGCKNVTDAQLAKLFAHLPQANALERLCLVNCPQVSEGAFVGRAAPGAAAGGATNLANLKFLEVGTDGAVSAGGESAAMTRFSSRLLTCFPPETALVRLLLLGQTTFANFGMLLGEDHVHDGTHPVLVDGAHLEQDRGHDTRKQEQEVVPSFLQHEHRLLDAIDGPRRFSVTLTYLDLRGCSLSSVDGMNAFRNLTSLNLARNFGLRPSMLAQLLYDPEWVAAVEEPQAAGGADTIATTGNPAATAPDAAAPRRSKFVLGSQLEVLDVSELILPSIFCAAGSQETAPARNDRDERALFLSGLFLPRVRKLRVAGCRVLRANAGRQTAAELGALQEADLPAYTCEYAEALSLMSLPRLEHLDVRGCPVFRAEERVVRRSASLQLVSGVDDQDLGDLRAWVSDFLRAVPLAAADDLRSTPHAGVKPPTIQRPSLPVFASYGASAPWRWEFS